MADAIKLGTQEQQGKYGQRALIVVTDGASDDRTAALAAGKVAKLAGIDIITIGTDDADITFLKSLASRTDLTIAVSQSRLAEGMVSAARLLIARKD